MARLYITNREASSTVPGSLAYCIANADDGDVISIAPETFTEQIVNVEAPSSGFVVSKSISIDPGNGKRLFIRKPAGISSERLLRIAGTSSARVEAYFSDLWVEGWESTSTAAGLIVVNYAAATFNRCAFGLLQNSSTTTGLYCSNGSAAFVSSVIYCSNGNAINYAASGTVTALNCTIIGGVKSGWSGTETAVISPEEVEVTFTNAARFCFSPVSSSSIATGREIPAATDLYGNPIPAGGAVGALAVCAAFEQIEAERAGNWAALYGGHNPRRLVLNDGYFPAGFSTSSGIVLESTLAGSIYQEGGDLLQEIQVLAAPDYNWLRACFLTLDIPAQTREEMASIIPSYKELFKE